MNDDSPFRPRPRETTWEQAQEQHHPQAAPQGMAVGAVEYLKQVYALLAGSLLVAFAAGVAGMSSPFAFEHPFILIALQLGALFLAMYVKNTATLFLFTGLSGFSLGPIIALYVGMGMAGVVGQALLMTGAAFGGITVYAFTTRRDLSGMGGMLFAGLIVLVVGGLINLFVQSTGMAFALSGMGALIFSGYLLYETQQLKQNPGLVAPSVAALSLYLNIVNLFLSLLRILGILGSDE